MSSLAAKSERTRRELIAAARSAFAERGYDSVSLRDITESLGLTKGAMYHHFSSKDELFREAVLQAEREVFATVAEALEGRDDPHDRFLAACVAYVRGSTEPDRARLLLDDGPTVLGWSRWLDFAGSGSGARSEVALGYRKFIEGHVAGCALGPLTADALSQFIAGGLMNSARWIARDRAARLDEGLVLLEHQLRSLLDCTADHHR